MSRSIPSNVALFYNYWRKRERKDCQTNEKGPIHSSGCPAKKKQKENRSFFTLGESLHKAHKPAPTFEIRKYWAQNEFRLGYGATYGHRRNTCLTPHFSWSEFVAWPRKRRDKVPFAPCILRQIHCTNLSVSTDSEFKFSWVRLAVRPWAIIAVSKSVTAISKGVCMRCNITRNKWSSKSPHGRKGCDLPISVCYVTMLWQAVTTYYRRLESITVASTRS